MAIIPIKIDRTSKPPLGTPLRSDGHWSAQGLCLVLSGNEAAGQSPVDVALNQRVSSVVGDPIQWTPDGLYFNGASHFTVVRANNNYIPQAASAFTFFAICTPDISAFGSQTRTIINLGEVTDLNVTHCMFVDASGKLSYGPDGINEAITSGLSAIAGKEQTLAIVNRGVSDRTFYSDELSWVNTSTRPYSSHSSSGGVSVGCSYVNKNPQPSHWLGGIKLLLASDFPLSDAQYHSLRINPWQIYEPETVWIEVGVGEIPVNYGAALMMGM